MKNLTNKVDIFNYEKRISKKHQWRFKNNILKQQRVESDFLTGGIKRFSPFFDRNLFKSFTKFNIKLEPIQLLPMEPLKKLKHKIHDFITLRRRKFQKPRETVDQHIAFTKVRNPIFNSDLPEIVTKLENLSKRMKPVNPDKKFNFHSVEAEIKPLKPVKTKEKEKIKKPTFSNFDAQISRLVKKIQKKKLLTLRINHNLSYKSLNLKH